MLASAEALRKWPKQKKAGRVPSPAGHNRRFPGHANQGLPDAAVSHSFSLTTLSHGHRRAPRRFRRSVAECYAMASIQR